MAENIRHFSNKRFGCGGSDSRFFIVILQTWNIYLIGPLYASP